MKKTGAKITVKPYIYILSKFVRAKRPTTNDARLVLEGHLGKIAEKSNAKSKKISEYRKPHKTLS